MYLAINKILQNKISNKERDVRLMSLLMLNIETRANTWKCFEIGSFNWRTNTFNFTENVVGIGDFTSNAKNKALQKVYLNFNWTRPPPRFSSFKQIYVVTFVLITKLGRNRHQILQQKKNWNNSKKGYPNGKTTRNEANYNV